MITYTNRFISLAAGGGQTDTLPGGGFHCAGGGQTDTLPGGGFHTAGGWTDTLTGRAASPPPTGEEPLSGFA